MATTAPVEDKKEIEGTLTRVHEDCQVSLMENSATNANSERPNALRQKAQKNRSNQLPTVRIFSIEDILRDVKRNQSPSITNPSFERKECIGGDSDGTPAPESVKATTRKTEMAHLAVPVDIEPRTSVRSFYGHCLPAWAMPSVSNGNPATGWLYPTLFQRQLLYDFNGKIIIVNLLVPR